ncbi:uncharacterized protein LOC135684406 [Rhopilema esculentum]|uniref:uncharacterized protein LOC135684406 n=1 Tax=Rhopilema esculentum TaxID=499914 RepID=UPI0031D8EBF0|eukprot:gene16521-7944_t
MALKLPAITVEPLMFLCMQSFFLHLVALPQIVLENVCLKKHNETKCAAMYTGSFKKEYDTVQEESTIWFGALLVAASFVTVLSLPVVATLSDEVGRRKIMSLSPLSQLIQSVILVCILSAGMRFPTWLLVLVGLIPTTVGDVSGLYVFTYSYISEITTEKTRTLRINLLEAASILSGFVSSFSSGFIIERFGYVGIYVCCLVIDILAIIYLLFFVKPIDKLTTRKDMAAQDNVELDCHNSKTSLEETEAAQDDNVVKKDVENCDSAREESQSLMVAKKSDTEKCKIKKTNSSANKEDCGKSARLCGETGGNFAAKLLNILKASNPIGNLKRVCQVLKLYGQLTYGLLLFLLMILAAITYSGELAVIVLYLKTDPYYLDSVEIGFFLAFQSGALAILGLVGFNFLFARFLKLNDHTILLGTALAYVAYCLLLGLANSTLMLYLSQIVHAMATLNVSTIRAMISKVTPPSTVGLLFSAMLIVEVSSIMIGAMWGLWSTMLLCRHTLVPYFS